MFFTSSDRDNFIHVVRLLRRLAVGAGDDAHQRADAVVEADRIVERILPAAVLRLIQRILNLATGRCANVADSAAYAPSPPRAFSPDDPSSSAFSRRISFTASFASENRSRICSATRDCSCHSASVALMRGSGSTLNVSVAIGVPPTVIRTLYVPGGTSGPVTPAAQRIIPGNAEASG